MAQYANPRSTMPRNDASSTSAWVGWIAFASGTMVLVGILQIVLGITALVKDEYFAVGRNGLMLHVDYTTWGWTHLVIGIIVVLAAVGILAGQIWARAVGTAIALVVAVVNLTFLAATPIWSTLMIALSVVVIMALTVHGRDIEAGW